MKDAYGSPELGDPAAEMEKDIEAVAQKVAASVRNEGPQILNRPLGSKPVPLEDQKMDYAQRMAMPDFWAVKFQAYVDRGMHPLQAAKALMEWEQKVRE